MAELSDGVRLACQIALPLAGDADEVEIPAESWSAGQRTHLTGQEAPLHRSSALAWTDLNAQPPLPDDPRADWERLGPGVAALLPPSPAALAQLPGLLRQHGWRVRLIHQGGRAMTCLPPDQAPLGLAVDLGTTSLAAYLVNLETGQTLAAQGAANPQAPYGADVIARIAASMQQARLGARLQAMLSQRLQDLAVALCAAAGAAPGEVVAATIVGNTAMHHLWLGLPVAHLGTAPYVPVISRALTVPAAALGLHLAPGAEVYHPPSVAGFVGGDHLAMLLAVDILAQPSPVLALDIGTNTEITLRVGERLLCCSAASGPAFEGAEITHGMQASAGAIERVTWAGHGLVWADHRRLTATGVVWGLACWTCWGTLLEQGHLTPTGAFMPGTLGHPKAAFEVVPAAHSSHGRAITLSRRDISAVQLAKGAIRAGIKLLLEAANLQEHDLASVILAGAFGNYLTVEHAVAIGLLPPLPLVRFRQVGNAAGMGAKRLLLSNAERSAVEALSTRLEYLELTTHPDFADRFSQAILLASDPWD
ncbi:MAG: ATP-binding protein [Anaerolineae bacterium]|nr:ATP-binding protein [Anaerolineae bacterium]